MELPLFERAAALYHRAGDERGEAEALFWVATYHQVVRADHDTAAPVLDRARDLGWSWSRIAVELGVSKQAVHQKHGGSHTTREA